jgi:hypothetical protein
VYYARVRYNGFGAGTSAFSVDAVFTTSAAVAVPALLQPLNNATDVGEVPTLSTTPFSVTGGQDTHLGTHYQVWTGPAGTGTLVWEDLDDQTNLLNVMMPAGRLAVNTKYYARARHKGTTLGYSVWSSDAAFTTTSVFAPSVIGAPYGGGYYGGRVQVGDAVYALVVAPKSSGEGQFAFKSANTAENTSSIVDGYADTVSLAASPDGSPMAAFVKGLTIAGYTDWYVPARDELEALYRNLKPTITINNTGARADGNVTTANGTNNSSSPLGAPYSTTVPGQTTATIYKTGNQEAFSAALYWSSTQTKATNEGYAQNFDTGAQVGSGQSKTNSLRVRAIRRVKIN